MRIYRDRSHFYKWPSPAHAPRIWPWWRLISFNLVRLGTEYANPTIIGWRLWMYTRWRSTSIGFYWRRGK